jgi:hypothetical protein
MKCKYYLFCTDDSRNMVVLLGLRFMLAMSRFFAPQNRVVTLKLIRYSMLMLLIPLATFYFFYIVIFNGK